MASPKAFCPVVGFNRKRAAWAQEALEAFMRTTGLNEADGIGTAIGDLLADLMHLADLLGRPFPALVRKAERTYHAETGVICRACKRRFDPWCDAAGAKLDTCTECAVQNGGGS